MDKIKSQKLILLGKKNMSKTQIQKIDEHFISFLVSKLGT